jgi:DNA-binding transcriptional regulator YiaG
MHEARRGRHYTSPMKANSPASGGAPADSHSPRAPAMSQASHSHSDLRASFAAAFRNWRRKHRIPLKAIAKDLGVSVSTVAGWESGEYFPTGYNLEILVDYTGLPPCRLFCVMADKCVPAECVLALRQMTDRPASNPGCARPVPPPAASSRYGLTEKPRVGIEQR